MSWALRDKQEFVRWRRGKGIQARERDHCERSMTWELMATPEIFHGWLWQELRGRSCGVREIGWKCGLKAPQKGPAVGFWAVWYSGKAFLQCE